MQSIHTITYRLFYPPKEYLALVRLEIAAKLQKKSEVCKKNLQKSKILCTFYLFFCQYPNFLHIYSVCKSPLNGCHA